MFSLFFSAIYKSSILDILIYMYYSNVEAVAAAVREISAQLQAEAAHKAASEVHCPSSTLVFSLVSFIVNFV